MDPKTFLGKEVELVIDRPLGSKHPEHGFVYEVNYGYIPNVMAEDGEELDAYYLGIKESVEKAKGVVIAIINRIDDTDPKLIVVPKGIELSDEEIRKQTHFQEQWFKSEILR